MPRRRSPGEKSAARSPILRPLGAQLRHLRRERQLTQETLAERAGLNYKYLGRVELGKADPGADVLVRIARALSVPVGELFETITPASPAPRLSKSDLEQVTGLLQDLTSAIDRLSSAQRPPTPGKPSRRSHRS